MISQYLDSTFRNYRGKEQHFTVCITSYMENGIKKVGVGIAVCHCDDKYDAEKGKELACKRSIEDSNKLIMTLSHTGLINKVIADAILESIVKYVKKNPEFAIPGYNDNKMRFQRRTEALHRVSGMSDYAYNAYALMKKLPEHERAIILKLCDL